jgi:hypothetical protein
MKLTTCNDSFINFHRYCVEVGELPHMCGEVRLLEDKTMLGAMLEGSPTAVSVVR